MRHHGCQRVGRIIRAHGDETDVEVAIDLVRKTDVDLDVEGAVGHVHLQSPLADGGHMLFIDIDECDVMPRPRESPADDPADGSGTDNDHARAHVNLLGDFTQTSQRYGKRAGPST